MSEQPKASNLATYDFRQPGRTATHVERSLDEWLRRASLLLADKFADLWSFPLQWEQRPLVNRRAMDVVETSPMVGALLSGTGQHPTLLELPRSLAQALVESALGVCPESLPEDRPLTTLESTVLQMILERVVDALSEARPPDLAQPLRLEQLLDEPKMVRLYPRNPNLTLLGLDVTGPFGAGQLQWLWSEPLLEELFGKPREAPVTVGDAAERVETLVHELPVELVVRLGSAQVPVADLARLQPGDVIVLDQRVTEPLVGLINGTEKLTGWPGRLGARLAFRLE